MNSFAIYLNVKSSTWNQGIFTYFFPAFLLPSLSVKELSRKGKKKKNGPQKDTCYKHISTYIKTKRSYLKKSMVDSHKRSEQLRIIK